MHASNQPAQTAREVLRRVESLPHAHIRLLTASAGAVDKTAGQVNGACLAHRLHASCRVYGMRTAAPWKWPALKSARGWSAASSGYSCVVTDSLCSAANVRNSLASCLVFEVTLRSWRSWNRYLSYDIGGMSVR